MSLIADSPAILERFDYVCSLVGANRQGITLEQLRDAHALARELENGESPNSERVEELCRALGIEVEALS